MPSSAVRANISPSRAAPSSMEYSVCTCRCTKESFTRDPVDMWGDRPFPDVDTDRAHAGTDLGGPAALLLGEDRQPTSRRPPDVEDVPVCSRVKPWHGAPTAPGLPQDPAGTGPGQAISMSGAPSSFAVPSVRRTSTKPRRS